MIQRDERRRGIAHDWNVVVTVVPEGYRDALRILRQFGDVSRTSFRDVLVMRVELDVHEFQQRLHELLHGDATLANSVARIIPVTERFSFASPAEFRTKANNAVQPWAGELAGKTFYVRMHRRGFHGELNSRVEESAIGEFILECIRDRGGEAHVAFEDPDVVIAVETVGEEAGLSWWSREDLERYEFLRFH